MRAGGWVAVGPVCAYPWDLRACLAVSGGMHPPPQPRGEQLSRGLLAPPTPPRVMGLAPGLVSHSPHPRPRTWAGGRTPPVCQPP